MRYVTSLPGENAECLCHGLVEVFEHIGGVPPVIVMDNATGAGRRNARDEATPAAVLDAFLAHHRIDARFRDPYSGWEKGAVENAVGFLRRNLMVPPLEARDPHAARTDHASTDATRWPPRRGITAGAPPSGTCSGRTARR